MFLELDQFGQPLLAIMKFLVPVKLMLEHEFVLTDNTFIFPKALRDMNHGLKVNSTSYTGISPTQYDAILFSIKTLNPVDQIVSQTCRS